MLIVNRLIIWETFYAENSIPNWENQYLNKVAIILLGWIIAGASDYLFRQIIKWVAQHTNAWDLNFNCCTWFHGTCSH